MKKIFFIFFMICTNVLVFAQTKDNAKDDYFSFSTNGYAVNYLTPDVIYSFCYEDDTYRTLDRKSFHLDDNGFFYYSSLILIPGAIPDVVLNSGGQTSDYAKSQKRFYNYYYKTKFTASSELIEQTKNGTNIYNAENLGKFAYAPSDHYESLSWNYEAKPWVEGVKGYGIGESITISSEEEFNKIIILNGYVDVNRVDLYKKNSRVKTFTLKDLDNKVDYKINLEDLVEFQSFVLSNKTKNVKLIIEDVYKGDKWDDTCITGLVTLASYVDPDVPLNQSYTYKEDKDKVLNKIEMKKETYKIWQPDPEFSGK